MRKRICVLVIVLLLSLFATACGGNSTDATVEPENNTIESNDYTPAANTNGGKYHTLDDFTPISTPGTNYYNSEPEYERCEICGYTYGTKNMYYSADSGFYICDDCLPLSDFHFCDRCGDLFHIDKMHTGDGLYCEWCWEYLCNKDIYDRQ